MIKRICYKEFKEYLRPIKWHLIKNDNILK